ncbi:hypothetical protein FNV43_RR22431 [Rhamnella rubrinervis]|uniref:HMA domain-containing protein n=1 Tax=Rhamnella rubrinervis TaxID=2594499 RepID=A0A8K0DW60_9ROSA|nr:hypothetical protein FNV43_RR22431 [Rhamnella rubrinervis]
MDISFSLPTDPSCRVENNYVHWSGVLKTEIDPLQPKVTVVGNVDPQILIKKLLKLAGKQAELWNIKGNNEKNGASGRKEEEAKTDENEKSESGGWCIEKAKYAVSSSGTTSSEKFVKEIAAEDNGDKGANSNKYDAKEIIGSGGGIGNYEVSIKKQMHNNINAVPISSNVHEHQVNPIPIVSTQYCYMGAAQVQPPPHTINVQPYYAIPSYYTTEAPPLLQSTSCYAQANCPYYVSQSHPTVFQAPATRAGDYFSDDNTMGCSVM